MKNLYILFAFIFISCGTVKETTTEVTEGLKIPAVKGIDTVFIYVPIEAGISDSLADYIGMCYLERYCQGTATVEIEGMTAKISFLTKRVSHTEKALLDKDKALKDSSGIIIELRAALERKMIELQTTKTTTTSVRKPTDFEVIINYWYLFTSVILLTLVLVSAVWFYFYWKK